MTTPRPGETATSAPMAHEETNAAHDHAHHAASHPCAARPVPASVQRQREVAVDTAFARAVRDADEAPVVMTTPSRTASDAAHSA